MISRVMLIVLLMLPNILFAASSGTCSVSTTPVNFGSYDVFSNTALDTVGQVTINCTGGAGSTYSVVVQLNKGLTGSISQRKLAQINGNDFLRYNLYTDASRSVVWGDGTGGSVTQTVNMTGGKSQTLTMYGRIPALQDVGMGGYSDTVGVTINF